MISTTTEKYNREAEELQIDKDAAYHRMEIDLETYLGTTLGNKTVSMDNIIKYDLLCHDRAPRIIKLMLTGHQDYAMKLLIETYDALAEDAITEAVDAHFWKD
tara:strand:- start:698 stop:1006 length:309 start_codon:yes stop_codon:yes gene_type:complete